MKILPWLAASAVDEPDIPAKNTDSSTLICASAPGKLPTIVLDSVTSRSVMPPTFIRLAVSRKNGTASRMNELYALNVVLKMTIGDSRGSMNSTGRLARPSANATGTRNSISRKNEPKSQIAATPGVSMAVLTGPLGGRRAERVSGGASSHHATRADVAARVDVVLRSRAVDRDLEIPAQ